MMDVVWDSRDHQAAGMLDDLLHSGAIDRIDYNMKPDETTATLMSTWPIERVICEGVGPTPRDAAVATLTAYKELCAGADNG